MFALTPAAAEQILRAAGEQADSRGRPMLRVAAKLDEDDGELVYGMGFDDEREDDLVIDGGGIKVLISPRSRAASTRVCPSGRKSASNCVGFGLSRTFAASASMLRGLEVMSGVNSTRAPSFRRRKPAEAKVT